MGSGSARFNSLPTIMENARFSRRIGHADRMVILMFSEPTAGWRWQFRYCGSHRESAVAQLFSAT
jgi:hypothetical protein